MEAKHTPGPWSVINKDPLQIGGNWRGHYYDEVCTIKPRQFDNVPVDSANAALIAAAPDLLAALELCERALEERDAEAEQYAAKRARAAIAKATGE